MPWKLAAPVARRSRALLPSTAKTPACTVIVVQFTTRIPGRPPDGGISELPLAGSPDPLSVSIGPEMVHGPALPSLAG